MSELRARSGRYFPSGHNHDSLPTCSQERFCREDVVPLSKFLNLFTHHGPTVPLIHAYHPPLWLTEKTGPSGVKRGTRLPQQRRRAESQRHIDCLLFLSLILAPGTANACAMGLQKKSATPAIRSRDVIESLHASRDTSRPDGWLPTNGGPSTIPAATLTGETCRRTSQRTARRSAARRWNAPASDNRPCAPARDTVGAAEDSASLRQ